MPMKPKSVLKVPKDRKLYFAQYNFTMPNVHSQWQILGNIPGNWETMGNIPHNDKRNL